MEKTEPSTASAPDQTNDFLLLTFFGIFICGGLLFFFFGLRELYQQSEFKRRSPQAIGVVSNYFDSNEILVTYATATGAEIYAMPRNIYLLRPAIGSRIHLWYNPKEPLEVVAQGGMPYFMQGGILALLIFGGVGATGFYFVWRSRQLRLWLYRHGQRVQAAFARSYWVWVRQNAFENSDFKPINPTYSETEYQDSFPLLVVNEAFRKQYGPLIG